MKVFAYKKFFKILIAIFSVAFVVLFSKACGTSSDLPVGDEISIPLNLSHVTLPQGVDLNTIDINKLNLQDQELDLVTVATSVQITVAACKTGNTYSTTVTNFVKLYTGDQSCLVKLTSFTAFGETFTPTGGTNFTTWLVNDKATFKSTTTAHTLYVLITSQVTQAGILGTDQVTYLFTDIQSTTTSSLPQSGISYSVPFSVTSVSATSLVVSVTGCSSGYTVTNQTITSGVVSLLKGDQNCLVKLINFTLSSTVFSISTNFTTWLAGNTAVFTGGGYNVTVTVVSQVTQSGVLSSDTVSYNVPLSAGCGTVFDGGSGTSGDPFQIASATTLARVPLCTTSSTYFIQTSNISLSGVSWSPGTLSGQYNGNSLNITSFSYTDSNWNTHDGLFTFINTGASISNCNLSGTVTSQAADAGILAGYNGGTITNCSVSGTMNHTNGAFAPGGVYVGAVVGQNFGAITSSSSSAAVNGSIQVNYTYLMGGFIGEDQGSITSSFETGNVTITSAFSGGIGNSIGSFAGSSLTSISNSYSTGNINTPTGAGTTPVNVGFVGQMNTNGSTPLTTGCFAKGTYTVQSGAVKVGGMAGNAGGSGGASAATITNSYSMVALSVSGAGSGSVGGFTGGTPTVTFSYSADPSISSNITAHGFFGPTGATATSSYYYTNSGAIPSDTSTGVTGLATQTAMQTQSNFTGFTFGTGTNNWAMPLSTTFSNPSGFKSPVQRWQCGANGISC